MNRDSQSFHANLLGLENNFIDRWQSSDDRPHIAEFVKGLTGDEYTQALRALIPIDVQYRYQTGQVPTAGLYASVSEQAVEIAAELFNHQLLATPVSNLRTVPIPRNNNGVGLDSRAPQLSEDVPRNLITDRYRLLHKIGQGGMGAVWMAQQEKPMRRRVAIKIIGTSLDSKEALGRFAAERQALAMMNHPNIAKVLDAGYTQDNRPFFAMELVKGIPITQYCNDHRLTIEQRLELLVPACQAVQHAHQKGIIHRDLKPSNILVTYHDGKPIPKVIDFGLAKALEHSAKLTDETIVTEFGRVVGTLQYMSPEQANSNELDVDTRTDIYSLGVVLYQLLTDAVPLERDSLSGKSLIQIVEMIRDLTVVKPSERVSEDSRHLDDVCGQRRTDSGNLIRKLEGELDWIVLKSLQRDRIDRYQTANGLARELKRFLNDEPVEARPLSRAYLLRKFVSKNRKLVATIIVVSSLLLALTIFSVTQWSRATQSELKKQRQLEVFLDPIESFSDMKGSKKIKSLPEYLTAVRQKVELIKDDWEFVGKVETRIGEIFLANTHYQEAKDALENAKNIYLANYGERHEKTLHCTTLLLRAELLAAKTEIVSLENVDENERNNFEKRYEAILRKFEEVDELRAANNGERSQIGKAYLDAYKQLKKLNRARKDLLELAISRLEEDFLFHEQTKGKEDIRTKKDKFSLANAYKNEGSEANIEKGISMYLELVEQFEKVLPYRAKALNNLAEAYHAQAKTDPECFDLAIKNFQQSLELKQSQGIPDYSETTFNTIRNLCDCYCDTAKQEQAKVLLIEMRLSIEKLKNAGEMTGNLYLESIAQIEKIKSTLRRKYQFDFDWPNTD